VYEMGVYVRVAVGDVAGLVAVALLVGVGDDVWAPSVSETGVAVEEAAICAASLHTRAASR